MTKGAALSCVEAWNCPYVADKVASFFEDRHPQRGYFCCFYITNVDLLEDGDVSGVTK